MTRYNTQFTPELREKLSKAHLGKKPSLETRMKMSETHKRLGSVKRLPSAKGRIVSAETREKLSSVLKGKIKTREHLKRIGLANKGKIHSEQTKIKISLAQKGEKNWNWKGGEATKKQRRVSYQLNRNIRKLGNGGTHSLGEWETLKAQYNFTCLSCKRQEPIVKLTRDHIIPISKGGSNNIENIQPLCKNCNSRKASNLTRYTI